MPASRTRNATFICRHFSFEGITCAAAATGSVRPCARKRNARLRRAGAPRTGPGARAPRATPRPGLRVSTLSPAPGTALEKFFHGAVPCGRRWLRSFAFSPTRGLWAAASNSPRRAALLRGRWRWLVLSSARHACLRECGAFPRAQIRPPACWALFLDAHLCGPVRWFFSQA